ncbi:hypothetical protein FB565_004498 [Actinoplanes lutulentus]|uniref:Uncharacterized protein n=1 Tax=Actinoplanes lutulentus TaxID=1287878 RepID=A0A327ZH46_9ACTN|nr:hypothetical protein [Actinoplanes lutulentus]MBB2944765.1 hypothetical protein [Actinoplanes lutulentus]RAK35441.1 hypothetical protein B0I29_110197 [Actinoplanes lutulentus]
MSRRVRYRVAAVFLCGLIFGAPLLASGTASAEQLDPGDRRVSFNGDGVLGLTCESKPSVESMKVPADSVIQVRNRTGHDARLKLGNVEKGTIPEDGSADLVFRRGTTSVMLTPECDHGEDVVPMIVTAEPSATSGRPNLSPRPQGGAATLSKPSGSGSPARTHGGSSKSGAASAAQRPDRGANSSRTDSRRTATDRPQASVSSAASAAAMPQGAVSQRLRAKPVRGTGGVGAPAFAGMPPGKAVSKKTAPATDSVIPSISDEFAVPVLDDEEPSAVAATDPVAAVGPIREGKPIGLLGMTALVCVLGVSIAAIRAIVSQRASRTNVA